MGRTWSKLMSRSAGSFDIAIAKSHRYIFLFHPTAVVLGMSVAGFAA